MYLTQMNGLGTRYGICKTDCLEANPKLAEQIANAKRKVLLKEMQKKAKDIN